MEKLSRRQLLQAAVASGAALLMSWLGLRPAAASVDPAVPRGPAERRFSWFGADELAFVNAALARLIPADELGPGAREADVAFFIDQQLAGSFGRAETWYMQGPWQKGTPEQGYQLKLTPAQLYRVAIPAIDAHCRRSYGGKVFAALAAEQQDEVLHGLEQGKIELESAPAKDFFSQFWENVNEGFFADPMYGGNRDFAGWKLVGFPGPRYNYLTEIEQYGKTYAMPPVGLLGRDGSALRKG
ncbi:MAG: gluconate 2-dehydrogenase subunit 3 family protein [Burkholderiaceae bacterium]